MLHNSTFDSAYRNDGWAASLNARFAHAGAVEVIKAAYREIGNVAMVSSFGADSVVLLRLIAQVNRNAPVLFIDTEMLFDETLAYQKRVADLLGLTNVQVIKAADTDVHDPDGTLHKTNPDACCSLRKTAPLHRALSQFDGWITGRKRHQSGTRARLNMFEAEDNSHRIKVNPLALWNAQDAARFMTVSYTHLTLPTICSV